MHQPEECKYSQINVKENFKAKVLLEVKIDIMA